MWQVRCEMGDGTIGKLVTRSWPRAVFELMRWRLKGRPARMNRYFGDALRKRSRSGRLQA